MVIYDHVTSSAEHVPFEQEESLALGFHLSMYIYIYIYICMCVCVCECKSMNVYVCMRAYRVCVNVYVRVYVCRV